MAKVACRNIRQAAFEIEAQNQQPIAVALVTASLDRFGDSLFAHGAELRADVKISFLLAAVGSVIALGLQLTVGDRAERDVWHLLVNKPVTHIAPSQWLRLIAFFD